MEELKSLVESHDKRIHSHDERLTNHSQKFIIIEQDIEQLKKYDKSQHERLQALEKSYDKLSDTVTKENEETRQTMKDQTGRLFDLVERSMGYQSTRTTQINELKRARLEAYSNIFLKIMGGLFGAGGLIYIVTEHLFK